jgi:hypothetical protein
LKRLEGHKNIIVTLASNVSIENQLIKYQKRYDKKKLKIVTIVTIVAKS